MRLLILTQYYPPEIGAPQNRLHELAVRLATNGIEVEVLTAMPNYPTMRIFEDYKKGQIREEVIDGISVHRAKIFVSVSKGIVARLLNYFSFVWTSYWRGKKLEKFDYLMVESPPLFLGYSAMALSRKLKAKLIFNVSDLWPESADKLGIVTNKTLLKFAYRLEAKCYRKAALITGQTNGIVADIQSRFPSKKVYWLPNGVDLSYYNPLTTSAGNFRSKHNFSSEDVLFFYGGILGHAQGLHVIIEAAHQLKNHSNIHFILQGAGPEKESLLELKTRLGIKNVHFFEPVSKVEMPEILKAVDVAIVPLRKLVLFEGAIPSKVFEALAMEKPLLLGVLGEAKQHFIDNAQAGLAFEPENVDDLVKQALALGTDLALRQAMGRKGRIYVNEHFNRNKIATDFYQSLINT